MRDVVFIFKFVLASILGFILQLFLHEAGHAMFAIITGNEVIGVSIGVVSQAQILILNEWSMPIISIASFILPVVVCALLEFIASEFVRLLSTMILTITTIQIAINAVAILFVKDVVTLQTYDLGVLITCTHVSNILVSIISLIITSALSIWILCKLKRIVEDI